MAPFRFGVQLSRTDTGPSWRATARKVEDLGYSTLFIPDHFEDQFGPLVALTVAAEATTTLRVGSLVFGNDYRHPVVLAKEVATLDLFSEGRVEFGLGAGWMTSDYEQSGIVADTAGIRISRMAESLTVLKALWSTGEAAYQGEHYQVSGAVGIPTPVQRPHPPIIIGGGGQRVLGIAAREADIVGVNPSLAAGYIGPEVIETTTAEYYHRRVAWIRQAAGARFDQLELQCLTFLVQVVPDRDEAMARLASLMSVTPEQVGGSPVALIGTTGQIADTLRQRREEFGFSYIVVHEAELEALAPVVAELTGT
ncbi:MAG TPA: TIGR03621 family F420-dependent LLM class oxidoreductase [Acidimicrobiales bacterium]|jgi:probable F420-dependent oxidoreductase|nr:TIGR03621 family F420-dependent LLM class oxidoreductase [Acidimicrobiales bacterium]